MITELPLPRSGPGSLDSGAMRTCTLAWVAACALMLAGAAAARERPNILFITVDDLNTDLGAYGHPIAQSPAIDRLAAEGMRFDAAYAQYPVCSPSRSSFLTGLYPQQTGIITNGPHFREFVPDIVTLPQFFAQHGYFTARAGKMFHYNVPGQIGTDGLDDPQSWNERRNPKGVDVSHTARVNTINPATPVGATLTWLSVAGDGSRHTDALVTDAAIDLLETHHPQRSGKPLFLAVGYFRPHAPFIAPSGFFELYPPESIERPADFMADRADIPTAALADRPRQLRMTEAEKIAAIRAYYASITFVDAQIDRLLRALEAAALRDSTIIVLLSDHGFHLGAHGLWQKGDLFEGSVRVPLILSVPEGYGGGFVRGGSSDSLAELVDLYPTLAELAGLGRPAHVAGVSLVPVLRNPAARVRESAYTLALSRAGLTRPEWQHKDAMGESIRTGRYRYTIWDNENLGAELYDYWSDPEEITNLADHPAHLATRERLAEELARRRSHASSGLAR